jgi:hypothetical protein
MEKQKYSYCEHCDRDLLEGELLSFVDFWKASNHTSQITHSYSIVCALCYTNRHEWCKGVFPDNCERCGTVIEYCEHFLESEAKGKHIPDGGLTSKSECRIICENCFNQLRSM